MTITAGVRLATTETVLHTMVGETAVLWVNFCNTTELPRLVTFYIYKSGGSASTEEIIGEITVNAHDTYYWSGEEKFILDTGDVVSAKCDLADTISAKVCYRAIPVLV
jgi:hypothetical protein